MIETEQTTLERIHDAAKREFLKKGFRAASLRNIVKTAGVTTGALYGYFSSKEALFASIVEPHAAAVMGKFMTAQTEFAEYENFVHSMVEVEAAYTFRYIEVLKSLGNEVPVLDIELCHMIASGMFEVVFEVIRHNMPKERAIVFVEQLHEFYTNGWMKIMEQ